MSEFKLTSALILSGTLLWSASSAVFAQQVPLQFSTQIIPAATGQSSVVQLQFRNESDKPIAAYTLRIERRDKNGKLISQETLTAATRGLGISKLRPSYSPGETWVSKHKVTDPQQPEIAVDMVLFEDGTHWGPDKAHSLARLHAMKQGAEMERSK